MYTNRFHRRKGFTLIELLLALTIFAFLATSFYLAFSGGFRAYLRGEKEESFYENARLVLNKIAMEFQNALYSSDLGLGGSATEVYFFILPDVRDSAKSTQPRRITYRLKKDSAGSSLIREEETWAESLSAKERKKDTQELAYPLEDLSFEYFHEVEPKEEESILEPLGRKEKVYEWVSSWKRKEGFPLGFKLELVYPRGIFARFIPSPLRYHFKEEEEAVVGGEVPEQRERIQER